MLFWEFRKEDGQPPHGVALAITVSNWEANLLCCIIFHNFKSPTAEFPGEEKESLSEEMLQQQRRAMRRCEGTAMGAIVLDLRPGLRIGPYTLGYSLSIFSLLAFFDQLALLIR